MCDTMPGGRILIVDDAETTAEVSPKIIKIFCKDAEKAIITLRETVAAGDLELFTITAHAMKSALANIGEYNLSLKAAYLEETGFSSYTERFIKALEDLIGKFGAVPPDISDGADNTEDTDLLEEQLRIIKDACDGYDAKTAFDALDIIKKKKWKPKTSDMIEELHHTLFLGSDFEGAAKMAEESLLCSLK